MTARLEHRDLEPHSTDGQQLRTVFESPGGWPGTLEGYLKAQSSRIKDVEIKKPYEKPIARVALRMLAEAAA